MVSLLVVSLFMRVPIDTILTVGRDKLAADPSLKERTYILIDNLMEMLNFYVEPTHFVLESYIYRLEEELAMRSLLSLSLADVIGLDT